MDIDNINHVGMAIRDIAETAPRLERMGFQLTPYSPHSAAWRPGDPVQPLGSGNRCVMFADTYLEVLCSENPLQQAARIESFLKRHQGAHIICFDCQDTALVDRRVRGLGYETSGVIPLQRDIDTPSGVRTAKFVRSQFAPKDSPEGYIQASTHLTPEFIYQPRYMAHPNGSYQLFETILVADDLVAFERRYCDYLGFGPQRDGTALRFRLPRGTLLTIMSLADVPKMLPGTLLAPVPGIAAISFRTRELAATRERIKSNGFTVVETGDRVLVPAEEAGGVAMMFGS